MPQPEAYTLLHTLTAMLLPTAGWGCSVATLDRKEGQCPRECCMAARLQRVAQRVAFSRERGGCQDAVWPFWLDLADVFGSHCPIIMDSRAHNARVQSESEEAGEGCNIVWTQASAVVADL